MIDVALLRPGRVEKHVYLGFPDRDDRKDIMKVALKQLNVPVPQDGDGISDVLDFISDDPIAALFTPADLTSLVKSAFMIATQEFINGDNGNDNNDSDNNNHDNYNNANNNDNKNNNSDGNNIRNRITDPNLLKSGIIFDKDIKTESSSSSSSLTTNIMKPSHLLSSLKQTRSSISEGDRAFYEGIYKRFKHSNGESQVDIDSTDPTNEGIKNQKQTLV